VNHIWRSKRRLAVASATAVLALILSACSGSSDQSPQASGDPYTGSLTYWFWGESDVPGSTAWMQPQSLATKGSTPESISSSCRRRQRRCKEPSKLRRKLRPARTSRCNGRPCRS